MGNNTPNNKRSDEIAADQKLIDGLTKHAATLTSLFIGGVAVANKDIITTVQPRIDTATAAESTRASWQMAVQASRAERAETKAFVSGLRQALLVAYAGQIDVLADFGLTPRKPRVVSTDTKIVAAAKAKATREARHTLGKKQKSGIHGAVPSTISVATGASTSTPAPAPTAPTNPAPVTPATPVAHTPSV
jgi:hypothetical protein